MSMHSQALPPAESDLLAAAAEEFYALARSLNSEGHSDIAIHLYGAASALDRALPQKQEWWSNPFNSQKGRSQLFLRMLDAIHPTAVIETGTFRGTTAAFMAKNFGGPIFTCEVDPRWYLAAQADLRCFSKVDIRCQDSREFLKAVLTEIKDGPLLYYLDAHWQDDLPLADELDLILSDGRSATVIIDDFAVPFDSEYQFDDYGPGKALTLELLVHVKPKGASLFFPTLPACEETGARRGCAVIGVGQVADELSRFTELRRYDWLTEGEPWGTPPKSTISSLPNLEPLRRLVKSREIEIDRMVARAELELLRRECDELRTNAEVSRRNARSI